MKAKGGHGGAGWVSPKACEAMNGQLAEWRVEVGEEVEGW